jgi:hypothetical protein
MSTQVWYSPAVTALAAQQPELQRKNGEVHPYWQVP